MENHYQLGLQLYELGRYREAIVELTKATSESPDNPENYILLAYSYKYLDRYPDAFQAVKQSIAVAPDYPRGHLTLGWLHLQQAEPQKALNPIENAVRLDPEDPYAHYLLGLTNSDLGRHAQAKTSINQAVELDPLNADYFAGKATVYFQAREKEVAMEAVNESLRLNPENPTAFDIRSKILRTTTSTGAAISASRESLRLDPTDLYRREQYIETTRSRSVIYRKLLLYQEWVNSLPAQSRYAPGLLIFIIARLPRVFEKGSPQFYVALVFAVIAMLFYFTWILADVLLDGLLLLDPKDRYTIDPKDRMGLISVLTCFAAIFLSLFGALFNKSFLLVALFEFFVGFFAGGLMYKAKTIEWKGTLMTCWALLIHIICLIMVLTIV